MAETINRGLVKFTDASTPGNYVTLYTAGANGSRCYSITSTNNDPSATHLVTVQVFNSGVGYGGVSLGTVNNAGFTAGSPPQSMGWSGMPIDEYGNGYIQLAPGDTLQATFFTAITAGKVLNVTVAGIDY